MVMYRLTMERDSKEPHFRMRSMNHLNFGITLLSLAVCILLSGCNNPSTSNHDEAKAAVLPSSASRIRFARVVQQKVAPTLHCTGQIKPDFGKECLVSTRLEGRVLDLLVQPGAKVKRGQVLGYVDSQQVSEIQAQAIRAASALEIARAHEQREKAVYHEELTRPKALTNARTARQRAEVNVEAAQRTLTRTETLFNEKISAEKDYLLAKSMSEKAELELQQTKLDEKREEKLFASGGVIKKDWQLSHAETKRCANELATIKQRLKFLGVPSDLVGDTLHANHLNPRLPIIAPAAGTIVQQFVSPGEIVRPDESIFSICQIDKVAVDCQLPEADLSMVKKGSPIEVRVATFGDRVFNGNIVYVGSRLDAKTRSVPARALLDNKDNLLKLNMFATVSIKGDERSAIVCPKDALHESHGKNVAYVREGGKFIEKPVTTGITCGDLIEAKDGLKVGDEVVTEGGVLVKMELLMENKTQ